MADVTINYEGNTIASTSASGTTTLLTAGKYCEDDIEIVYLVPGGAGEWTTDGIATQTEPNGDITISTALISDYAFYARTSITGVNAPNVTTIGTSAFQNSPAIVSFSAPNATKLGNYWAAQTHLSVMVFQNLNSISSGQDRFTTFNTFLTAVDLNGPNFAIYNKDFENSSSMNLLVLRSSSLISLLNVSAFNGTPFRNGGAGGTIYIPEVLYNHLGDNSSDDYKAANNWSTVNGYGTITWAKIEGSYYETHYADDTTI